jgi:hypothetical protein
MNDSPCFARDTYSARHLTRTHPSHHNTHTQQQLTRLQQQYLEGKHTDMVIRVRVIGEGEEEEQEPSTAKRMRISAEAADVYTDIKTHSLVLRTRSLYFDRALSGEWTEAAERRVELEVADEQELEDLKLLIKLSYSDSYTQDNGLLLPLATRLRLAMRADWLEFVEALDQIVASLAEGLDFEGALVCMGGGLPPVVEAHPGIALARTKMAAPLLLGIRQLEGKTDDAAKQQLQAGVDALAKCLGPVAGMFEEGKELVYKALPLRGDVN